MNSRWTASHDLSLSLISDGWLSPNTYCNNFAPLEDIPAIYLFTLFRSDDFKECLVAYVGMSTRLKQRISGHDVLTEVRQKGAWTKVWFKPTPHDDLRHEEASYITRFDPPWNIQGRVRGLVMQ